MFQAIIQGFVIIAVLAVFQPVILKSIIAERKEETPLHLTRLRREGTGDQASPQEDANVDPTPCPGGQSFCESAADYPTKKIQDLAEKHSTILNHSLTEVDNAGSVKIEPQEEFTPVCPTKQTVIYPSKARSEDGNFEFIVNDDNHRQGVRIETCLTRDTDECLIPAIKGLGYRSRCVQKFIYRTLVVLNRNSSGTSGFNSKPFSFPSGCSCGISLNREKSDVTPVEASGPSQLPEV